MARNKRSAPEGGGEDTTRPPSASKRNRSALAEVTNSCDDWCQHGGSAITVERAVSADSQASSSGLHCDEPELLMEPTLVSSACVEQASSLMLCNSNIKVFDDYRPASVAACGEGEMSSQVDTGCAAPELEVSAIEPASVTQAVSTEVAAPEANSSLCNVTTATNNSSVCDDDSMVTQDTVPRIEAAAEVKSRIPFLSPSAAVRNLAMRDTPQKRPQTFPDIRECAEYADDVYFVLFRNETALLPSCNYMMDVQRDISVSMRMILVDWMVEVVGEFKLHNETLFLAVNYLDRFLCKHQCLRGRLQLIGVACLMIATKYEEMFCPTAEEFVFMTDHTYSRQELLDMESQVLCSLKFELTAVTAVSFLRRYAKVLSLPKATIQLASYIMELSLLDYFFMDARPSIVALGAVCVALHNRSSSVPSALDKLQVPHSMHDVRLACKHMHEIHTRAGMSQLRGVVNKYKSPRNGSVAELPPRVAFEDMFSAENSAKVPCPSQGVAVHSTR